MVLAYDERHVMPEPIEIHTDDAGLHARLSFGGVSRPTSIPWAAIVLIDQWPDAAPPRKAPALPKPRHLKLVPDPEQP